ncbi:uncharacterized protein [Dermacentor andersoni]|uniref:uncharacterized protein isoform X2 n=1 Tax=Dermacentor andersoni TaxID=34620 RepID=UPI002416D81B|nr:uncharacterized protein LOC129380054 isoform X2 [Dermacentor andersoni]
MASQDQRYTLCGFTMELDWRPLHFAERIPAHRICSACGVLPRETVFLPCRDVLCRSCYEQCQVDDGYACPLDGDQFLPEEAEWRDFPMENLLRRKIFLMLALASPFAPIHICPAVGVFVDAVQDRQEPVTRTCAP